MKTARLHRRRLRWLVGIFLLMTAVLVARPRPVDAHPLGNFSVNRYSRLDVAADLVTLFYVVDMAEIPVFQMMDTLDTDRDQALTAAEVDAFAAGQAPVMAANLSLLADGRSLPWQLTNVDARLSPGQADLPTIRFEWSFTSARPATSGPINIAFRDNNFADRLGWREVIVTAAEGGGIAAASVPAVDLSDALRNYPEGMLAAPPAISSATFTWLAAPGTAVATNVVAETAVQRSSTLAGGDARLAELISGDIVGPGTIAIALLLALTLGALHALSPGHGKTIVGAYLVGARGTPRHALFLGLTTTITHTAGVFIFGLLVLFASRYILPERLYPWLGVLSGLLVLLIGASLIRGLWRRAVAPAEAADGYHYHLGLGHTHAPPTDARGVSWRNLLALGVSGGLLPCPSALLLLLAAIALGKVALGLLLIAAFSVGLAGVLTGIGLALVYAGRLFDRSPLSDGRLARLAPIFSAVFVTLAGAAMTIQALRQIGLI